MTLALRRGFTSKTAAVLTTILLVFALTNSSLAADLPAVQRGVLNSVGINLNEVRLPLNGAWNYYDNQLLTPEECAKAGASPEDFPQLWNDDHLGSGAGQGFATYSMLVLTDPAYKTLSLEIPQIYSSYQLWVNGKLVAKNGKVGKEKEETTPQWLPQTVTFENTNDTLQVVLQIANFQHSSGGIKESIYLGAPELMASHRKIAVVSNLVESIVLLTLGLIFVYIYFAKDNKRIVLYFALLCISWSIRSVFSNLYLAITFAPDFNWYAMIRIEYVTLFLTMIWAILFLNRLFIREGSLIMKYLFVGCNSLFVIFTLLLSPTNFTQWLPVYLFFATILLIYGIFVVLWALINERVAAKTLLITTLLGIVLFGYDILTFEGFFSYNAILFSVGYIIIFLLIALALLLHLNIVKSKPNTSGILRYEDLYKKDA